MCKVRVFEVNGMCVVKMKYVDGHTQTGEPRATRSTTTTTTKTRARRISRLFMEGENFFRWYICSLLSILLKKKNDSAAAAKNVDFVPCGQISTF